MKLRIIAGPNQGQLLDLEQLPLSIGRDASCDLSLPLEGVSREHARILLNHGVYQIEDLGSTNGVRVNGEQISGSRTLLNGDRIGIGDAVLLFTDAANVVTPPLPGPAVSDEPSSTPPLKLAEPRVLISIVVIVVLLAGIIWLLLAEPAPEPLPEPEIPIAEAPAEPPRPRRQSPKQPADPADTAPVAEPPDGEELTWYAAKSEPAGATVYLDGEPMGTTPQVLTGLLPGRHELRMELAGYSPAIRYVVVKPVATAEPAPIVELEQRKGTCRVTSEPSGATAFLGPRRLGTTPLSITSLPAGDYRLHLVAYGHEPVYLPIRIDAFRATTAHAMLGTGTGTLRVRTLPAGATVELSGQQLGTTPGAPYASEPLVLRRLAAGTYVVRARWGERRSAAQNVTIEGASRDELLLVVWIPSTTVTLGDGRKVRGMLEERRDNGDLVLRLRPDRQLVIPADKYDDFDFVPYEEFLRQQAVDAAP